MTHRPRKRFGQHFLNDANIIQHIIMAIAPQADEHIVEIGPGLGALTFPLLEQDIALTAIELDRDVVAHLQKDPRASALNLIQADALKFDFATLPKPLRLVGNLPYNISTPLLFHLLQYCDRITDMYFMLQKEVAERLAADVNTPAYSRLSIMAQYYCDAEILFPVPPDAFDPPPKVDSAIIRLTPHTTLPHPASDFSRFADVVRTAFNQRRKTLRNSLKTHISAEQLEQLGINPQQRPAELSLADYVCISNSL